MPYVTADVKARPPLALVADVTGRDEQRPKLIGCCVVHGVLAAERAEVGDVAADTPTRVARELDAIVPVPFRHEYAAHVGAEGAGRQSRVRTVEWRAAQRAREQRGLHVRRAGKAQGATARGEESVFTRQAVMFTRARA